MSSFAERYRDKKLIERFELEVACYTGASYAVAVDSCSTALFLICRYLNVGEVTIPSQTFSSVPHAIFKAGGSVVFDARREANDWVGLYQLKPYPVYDSARCLRRNMFIPGSFMALSFNEEKPIPIGSGGMILTDSEEAAFWFREAVYDSNVLYFYFMNMKPELAERGFELMQSYDEDAYRMPATYRDVTSLNFFSMLKVLRDEDEKRVGEVS